MSNDTEEARAATRRSGRFSSGYSLRVRYFSLLVFAACASAQTPRWIPQDGHTQAGLRGVSAVNNRVVWASGSGGTWLRSTDGGSEWQSGTVPGAAELDFRGIRAFTPARAIVMSAGQGDKSRVYETRDAGASWTLLFTNPDAQGFWDSVAFWDAKRGLIAGDSVNGQIAIFTTADGGRNWSRRTTPAALEGEGAFAASNTSLCLAAHGHVWFGSSRSRVFHSTDFGATWTVASTPIRRTSGSSGIFSVAFRSAREGMIVGGDYAKDHEPQENIAVTSDAGLTWTAPKNAPAGFRSAVLWLPDRKAWLATGTSGSDYSSGAEWKLFDSGSFNALSGATSKAVWAVGAKGRIARLEWK